MKLILHGRRTFWDPFRVKMLLVFSVIGPGIITGTADNDAGGITTYAAAGAQYGYGLLWVTLLITLMLAVTQEMGARMGLVTGKGLAALIRENFSLRATAFVVALTFLANFANILAEYAGIATVADMYGVPRIIALPIAGLFVWWIVAKGSFRIVQRVFLASAAIFICYLFAGFMASPTWSDALTALVVPHIIWKADYFYTAVAVIGTTITAWGQFFIQSYFVDKGIRSDHLTYSRWDVFAGSFWTNFIAFFIVVATAATLFPRGIGIQDAGEAALALEPFAGTLAKHLFAWGFLNASLLGLAVVSMTSSYLVTEAFGFEGRVDFKKGSEAYFFVFALCIFAACALMLLPNLPLMPILIGSQALNTFVLPVLFIMILKLLNDRRLMGKYANGPFLNTVAWLTIGFLMLMLIIMTSLQLLGVGK